MQESEIQGRFAQQPSNTVHWILLPSLVFMALVIYYPAARQNLPVALNVDDRTSLGVLLRFHQGSADPKFFMYPTLFYYLTYAFTAGFGFSHILLTGHLFNLALLGLTAWLSALFCIRQFASMGAGLIAAYCVLLSPTLASSGAYLCTDILLSAFTILSLDLLMLYFRSRSSQNWLCAMLALGCAVAAKYTAAVLFVVYIIGEVVYVCKHRDASPSPMDSTAASRFSRATMYSVLLAVSLAGVLVATFFPAQWILHFVALHRTNLDTRSLSDYLVFLTKLQRLVVEIAIGTVLMLFAMWRSERFYRAISMKRLSYGVLIVGAVFVLTTPYSLLDPTKFIYDLGALLRANVVVAGNHQQWSEYWHWLFDVENRTLVILGVVGLAVMAYRLSWLAITPFAFALIHTLAICTAHRGFARYLDPLLPLLYCGVALLFHEAWQSSARDAHSRNETLLWRTVLCVTAAVVLGQTVRKTVQVDRAAADHTAYYTAYEEVLKDAPSVQPAVPATAEDPRRSKVLYAGFAPSIELDLAGFLTREVSWSSIARGPIGQQLSCDEILILNERSAKANNLDAAQDVSLDVLLDDPRGEGQLVVRRRGCAKILGTNVNSHL